METIQKNNSNNESSNPRQVRNAQVHFKPTVSDDFKNSGYGQDERVLSAKNLADKTIQDAKQSSKFTSRFNRRDSSEEDLESANIAAENAENEEEAAAARDFYRQNARQKLGKQKLRAPLGKAKVLVARTRASTINSAAIAWQGPLWLTFQLPLALFNIITLAAVGAMDTVTAASSNPVAWVAGKLASAAAELASLIGVDFGGIALAMFFITEVAILGFGIMSIFFLYLQYKMALLEPFAGQHSGLKMGVLMLVILGYTIPIANLFPFVFLWMAVVWLYPK